MLTAVIYYVTSAWEGGGGGGGGVYLGIPLLLISVTCCCSVNLYCSQHLTLLSVLHSTLNAWSLSIRLVYQEPKVPGIL